MPCLQLFTGKMTTTPGGAEEQKVGPVITFCHPAIKILMNCILNAEDSNVVVMLDVIVVGLGYQRNELKYNPVMISYSYGVKGKRRREFKAYLPFLIYWFQKPLPIRIDFPPFR